MPPARKCCPTCGQPTLPATGLGLSPMQWRVYEVLRRRPDIPIGALQLAVWADADDGGGEYTTLKYHLRGMNRRLRPHGIEARPNRNGGPDTTWRLYHINQEAAE